MPSRCAPEEPLPNAIGQLIPIVRGDMPSRTTRVAVSALCLFLSFSLSACAPTGVTIPPGSENLELCPPQEILVEELQNIGEPDCDLKGSSVVFPDGNVMPVVAVGDTWNSGIATEAETSDEKYVVLNWGVPGIAASVKEKAGSYRTWATSDAARKLQNQQLNLGR